MERIGQRTQKMMFEYNGQRKSLSEWGLLYHTKDEKSILLLYNRVKEGWTISEALETPRRVKRPANLALVTTSRGRRKNNYVYPRIPEYLLCPVRVNKRIAYYNVYKKSRPSELLLEKIVPTGTGYYWEQCPECAAVTKHEVVKKALTLLTKWR